MKRCLLIGVALLGAGFLSANPAVHINDFNCGLFDGNGNFKTTTDSRTVVTDSRPGVTILKCSAKKLPNATGKAAHFNFANKNVPCNTQSGTTNDWSETVSASGDATLTCKVRH